MKHGDRLTVARLFRLLRPRHVIPDGANGWTSRQVAISRGRPSPRHYIISLQQRPLGASFASRPRPISGRVRRRPGWPPRRRLGEAGFEVLGSKCVILKNAGQFSAARRSLHPVLRKSGISCSVLLQLACMVTASGRPTILEFGRFRVVPYRRQLLADDRPVRLGGRTFDLLMTLIEASGGVVGKDQLLSRVWPDRIVEENRLQGEISALRKAFGADRGLIQTVSGRGYQFTGEIRELGAGVSAQQAPAPFAVPAPPGPETSPSEGEAELIDREAALAGVTDHVATHRLATPVGDGGIGEERPGFQVARQPPPEFADEVTKHNEAEHRQITAMSCEAIGAATQADRIGLEDLLEAIGAFQHCVSEIVGHYSGSITSRFGNTVLVLFGYPAAHEHDAEQAVHAGLELCAAVKALRPDAEVPMRCRVGIATGMVIIGDLVGVGGVRDHGIIGDVPDLAVRLQVSAQPDAVTVDRVTRCLIGNLFDCRDLGALETNIDTEPTPRWQVLGESAVASRFEALRGSKLTRLVGRDEEINLLLRRWARVKAGDGQVILVSGEAGIGKSRITAAFEERLYSEPHLRLRHFCSPYHQDSALFPIIDQLSRAAGFARDDSPAAKLAKFEVLLAGPGAPSASKSQSATEKGKDAGGAGPPA
jgi:DNA-binding winged helix-turn-helix (wHTH) protein/class 3 adenylate cyclase